MYLLQAMLRRSMVSSMSSRRGKQQREERESLPGLLGKPENASLPLMQSTLSNNPPKVEEPEVLQTVAQIVGLKQQMKQQLIDMETNLEARVRHKESIDRSLNISLEFVHPQMQTEVCAVKNKDMGIYRMQCSRAIQGEIESDTLRSRSLLEVLNRSAEMCNKAFCVQMNNQKLEEKVLELRRHRIADCC
ncbi:uncharacterized protein [Ambystoma mexicanum]|uniref:uncharacterized protein isoform X2 n=1 Tax=Ambystoma mexicanum TaxID=8296 RepID=UPI0037E80E44